jgi:hypothetical protein
MGNKLLIAGIAALVFIVLPTVFYVMHYMSASVDVVTKEIEPSVIQQKYVYFQNLKASIDNADANIRIQINAAKAKKSDQNRSDWDRTDKEIYSRSIDDISGVIALRNGLIRDYNGAMSQWQMGFTNLGSWPKGAEYQPNDFRQFPESYPEYNYGDEMKTL